MTTQRLARPLPDVPSQVTVLARDDIDRTPALSSDDLIRTVPSAATFRRTPALVADPTSQGVNLRGVGPSGVSRALVLLDGMPVNDPFGGWVYWRALPRLGLERIEIAPGGTSALYGNYGLGGAVHLLSRPIASRAVADVLYGSLGTTSLAGHAAGRASALGGALDLELFRSDGYVPVTPGARGPIDRAAESRHGVLSGRVELLTGPSFRLTARGAGFDEEQNGGTTFTTSHVRTGTFGLSATGTSERRGELQLAIYGSVERFSQRRARIAMGRVSETLAAEQHVPSHAQGGSAVWTSPLATPGGTHRLVAGLDVRRVSGWSNEEIVPAQPDPSSLIGRRSGGTQAFAGAFMEDLYAVTPRLELSAVLRLDRWWSLDGSRSLDIANGTTTQTSFADRTALELSPRLGLLIRPSEGTRLRAAAYRSFRAPTLNELYRPFQVGTIMTAANEGLGIERLVGAEVGFERLMGRAGTLRLTVFYNVLLDPIVNATLPAPLPSGATRQRQNLDRARIQGVEVSGEVRLARPLTLAVAYTLADARVTRDSADPALVGKRLPQDPLHRAWAGVFLSFPRRIDLAVNVRVQSGQFEDDLNTLPMAGYALLDAFLAIPMGAGVSVIASAQNVLDRSYPVGRAGVDTIGPPRLILAGLRLR